jgi:hypothetical protein
MLVQEDAGVPDEELRVLMSIVCSPSASMKVSASRAIASIVSGTVPLEEATPALLNGPSIRSVTGQGERPAVSRMADTPRWAQRARLRTEGTTSESSKDATWTSSETSTG